MLQTNILNEPIFVGRKQELNELHQFLDSAIDGCGNTVVISGEAGSGKTRLMIEFLENVKKNDAQVLSGWCLSNASVPYFPFIEAFEPYVSIDNGNLTQQKELKFAFTELNRDSKNSISPQIWKDQTFAGITQELLSISTKRPIVLFIDDLQWADSASLSLLHYISRSIEAERILIIATYRKEELASPNNDISKLSPLLETLRLMGREGYTTKSNYPASTEKKPKK